MHLLIFVVVTLYISFYCFSYGKYIFKNNNRLGGIAVIALIPIILLSSITFYIMR